MTAPMTTAATGASGATLATGRRVLVTGGSGFIGTNLVAALLAAGHQVRNVDLRAPMLAQQAPVWTRADILDRDALVAAFRDFRPDLVCHLAARTDMFGARVADYPANTDGVANLIAAARAVSGLQRVVFASSRLVCRIGYQPRDEHDYLPTTAYGESKVIGEQLVRAAGDTGWDWAIVRPTSIWGPWFGVPYRNFFDVVRRGRYLHPRGHVIRKSFGFVGNTVHQLQQLLGAPAPAIHRRMFYLADYQPIEVRQWGELIRQAFDAPPIRELPLSAMRMAARAGDGLSALGWKGVPLTSFRLDNLLTEMLHDTGPLREVCGVLPYDIAEAVPVTTSWMQADG